MKRPAVIKIIGILLWATIFASASSFGQSVVSSDQPSTKRTRQPLNALPPIVQSDETEKTATSGASKALFLPPSVKSLPPIVTAGENLRRLPVFVPEQSNTDSQLTERPLPPIKQAPRQQGQSQSADSVANGKTKRPSEQQPPKLNLPPITQGNGNWKTPQTGPQTSELPPIVQPNLDRSAPVNQPVISGSGVIKKSQSEVNAQETAITVPTPFNSTTKSEAPGQLGEVLSRGINSDRRQQKGRVLAVGQPVSTSGELTQQGSGTRTLPPSSQPVFNSSIPPQVIDPAELPAIPEVELDVPTIGQPVESVIENSGNELFSGSSVPESVGSTSYFDQNLSNTAGDFGCPSCGPNGCYDPARVRAQNGCSGSVPNAGRYLFAEAIFWTRADGDIQLSSFFGLNDFNAVGGGRFTLGFRDNATQGRELTYFGTGNLDETETLTSPAGALQPLFAPGGGITPPTNFLNATLQTQSKETQIQSLEYNRINWGWDLLKTFVGARYIYFDDSTSFFSTNAVGNALFTQDSVNNLFGLQAGFELFYDVGYRGSASFSTKFGGYVNAANIDTNLFNQGIQLLDQEIDDGAAASTIEFNLTTHYQVSPRARFRVGYDVFLGWGLFTVENNIPRPTFAGGMPTGAALLTPLTGTELNTNNDPVFFHGPSVGFEVFR